MVWFRRGLFPVFTPAEVAATAMSLLGGFLFAQCRCLTKEVAPIRRQEQHQTAYGEQGSADESAHTF
jgi:hypothetical protein